MWRDIQRQAPKYAMAISSIPAAHPLKEFARANLVGVIVNREGRYLQYFITTYKYWLLEPDLKVVEQYQEIMIHHF